VSSFETSNAILLPTADILETDRCTRFTSMAVTIW
jgi:hypothetical protein